MLGRQAGPEQVWLDLLSVPGSPQEILLQLGLAAWGWLVGSGLRFLGWFLALIKLGRRRNVKHQEQRDRHLGSQDVPLAPAPRDGSSTW